MTRLPPFKHIEAFVEAARSLSFSATASAVYITVPAVSRRIKALEDELGVMLFERRARSLELTRAGRAYAENLAPAIEAIRHACEIARTAGDDNCVRVNARPSFAASWLFARLHRFTELHHASSVEIETSPHEIDANLCSFDVAVRLGDGGGWPGFRATPLLEAEIYPVCSPAFFRRHLLARPPAAMLGHSLLGSRQANGMWPQWLAGAGADPRDVAACRFLEFEDSLLAYEAAASGLGIALGVDVLAEPLLRRGRLVRPFDVPFRSTRKFHVLTRPGKSVRPLARAFAGWLAEEARGSHGG